MPSRCADVGDAENGAGNNLVLNCEAPGLHACSLKRRVDHRHTSRALGARHAGGGICQRSVQQSNGIHKRRISDRDVIVERYAAVTNTVSAANRSLAVPKPMRGAKLRFPALKKPRGTPFFPANMTPLFRLAGWPLAVIT